MPVSFDREKNRFTVSTDNSEYIFEIDSGKYLVHLYYGAPNPAEDKLYRYFARSFSPHTVEEDGHEYSQTDALSEYPFFGTGDFGTCSLRIQNADGNSATELRYDGYEILENHPDISPLPYPSSCGSETLHITLFDVFTGCRLNLYYTPYEKEDIITRYASIENLGNTRIHIEKLSSLCCDLKTENFDLISLYGDINYERMAERARIRRGRTVIESRRGASSHRFNPFIALCSGDAGEEEGDVYAFNLMYSGSFKDEIEYTIDNKTRINIGINDDNFNWLIIPGEVLNAPVGIMTYTGRGLGDMSRKMHDFIRKYILPENPLPKEPVVLNSWEGNFFNINEERLLAYADGAKEAGMDMLVMDDGWFGKRTDDSRGLGDWYENPERFPDGLPAFVKKVKEKGLLFGIWVEPEMVNPDSELYRAHPEYALSVPGRIPHFSRNQLVLNMSNPAVVNYIFDTLSALLDRIDADYIKWDFNRNLSDVSSNVLPPERQGEVWHRYILGTYSLLRRLRERYPGLYIETCSGGGGRYDLGMMKFGNRIWTSDNTRPEDRTLIQYGSLLAYPAQTMSCHVSDPRGDLKEMKFRFDVASQGMPGYEFDVTSLEPEIKAAIPAQINFWNKISDTVKNGSLYRVLSPFEGGISAFYYISEDRSEVLILASSADNAGEKEFKIKIPGLESSYAEYPDGAVYDAGYFADGVEISINENNKSCCRFFIKKD